MRVSIAQAGPELTAILLPQTLKWKVLVLAYTEKVNVVHSLVNLCEAFMSGLHFYQQFLWVRKKIKSWKYKYVVKIKPLVKIIHIDLNILL